MAFFEALAREQPAEVALATGSHSRLTIEFKKT
jgi:hypothetical protein